VRIGVTLPNGIPGIASERLLEWGTRAEALGFSVLGAISRINYPSLEELTTLAVVAGATKTIRLMPTVLVAPVREPVLLAKQAQTLNRLSEGRLVLGMGSGLRDDDFTVTGTDYGTRGKRFDEMLERMHTFWGDDPVPVVFGANIATPPVVRRIARWGTGFMAAGSPQMVQPIVDAVREEWTKLGRDGGPRLIAASYFTFGGDEEAEANLRDYYSFLPPFGEMAIAGMLRDPKHAQRYVDHFADAGYDEMLFSAASSDPDQLDALANAVL
jgi:alkanesulfonate monooxygenase SsuD/methylene tetrahydromethanopterin reductase-like flavin-dependent oxidoreductase (luciferase family)